MSTEPTRRAGKTAFMLDEISRSAKKRDGVTRVLWVSATGEALLEYGPDGRPVLNASEAPRQIGGPEHSREDPKR